MNKLNFCTKCIVHIWFKENKKKNKKTSLPPPKRRQLIKYHLSPPFSLSFCKSSRLQNEILENKLSSGRWRKTPGRARASSKSTSFAGQQPNVMNHVQELKYSQKHLAAKPSLGCHCCSGSEKPAHTAEVYKIRIIKTANM